MVLRAFLSVLFLISCQSAHHTPVSFKLPIGGLSIVLVFLLLHIPDRETTKISSREKLAQLDGAGLVTLIAAIVYLLIAL